MPIFDLPIQTNATSADVDSLAARQARNWQQTRDSAVAFLRLLQKELGDRYAHVWGKSRFKQGKKGKPLLDADGKPVFDPAQRYNENNLSPAEAIASMGTSAAGAFADFALLVPVSIGLGVLNSDGTHPVTGENMTRPPDTVYDEVGKLVSGWTVTFAEDNSGTAEYTAPAL